MSSELPELLAACDRILVMSDGRDRRANSRATTFDDQPADDSRDSLQLRRAPALQRSCRRRSGP